MMLTLVLEAAMRSLLMALAVWTSIRLLRVQAVFAQKVAWVLVLVAAGAMPLVMHAPWLALDRAVRIPMRNLSSSALLTRWQALQPRPAQTGAGQTGVTAGSVLAITPLATTPISKQQPVRAAAGILSSAPPPRPVLRIDDVDSPFMTSVISAPLPSIERSLAPLHPAETRPAYWNLARVRTWAIIAYLAIGGVLLLRILAGAGIAFRLVRRARPVTFFRGETATIVRVSSELATPVTIGSTVVLPANYRDWDATKLRVVLAHEESHVHQGDFYLQLLAAIHAAVFWFSPLGWWLKRKLTELGEALSDRAALEQAPDAASYAQVLLEFAAMPHRTPYAGVAMARSSNLSSRIERILNDRRFSLAFLGGRRHAILTALLVPAALVAVVACIRIVPAVEAAHLTTTAPTATQIKACTGARAASSVPAGEIIVRDTPTFAGQIPEQAASTDVYDLLAQITPAPPAPAAPNPPAPEIVAPRAPEPPAAEDEAQDVVVAPQAPDGRHQHAHFWIKHDDGNDDAFSIVHENGDGTLRWNGEYNDELAKMRKKMNLHGDYIWFEHDGQSYVVTDPAIVAQANKLFQPNEELEHLQAKLDAKQAELNKRMQEFAPEHAKLQLDSPEMKKQMAALNARLAELQSEKFKKLTEDLNKQINQEVLADLQNKMGDIQSQIGAIQGQIGEQMGKLGEKQGELGEEMGKIGEQMGRIGEEQGRIAEEASRKVKSILDQALKDGKVKPVD